MAGMNINDLRDVVISGNQATVTALIKSWEIYGERTGEDITSIVSDFNDLNDKLDKLYS